MPSIAKPNFKLSVLFEFSLAQKELDTSIATASGKVKQNLQAMRDVSSAYWLDVKGKIKTDGTPGETTTMEGILKDAASKSPAPMVTFIVYDLPNRDCHALGNSNAKTSWS